MHGNDSLAQRRQADYKVESNSQYTELQDRIAATIKPQRQWPKVFVQLSAVSRVTPPTARTTGGTPRSIKSSRIPYFAASVRWYPRRNRISMSVFKLGPRCPRLSIRLIFGYLYPGYSHVDHNGQYFALPRQLVGFHLNPSESSSSRMVLARCKQIR